MTDEKRPSFDLLSIHPYLVPTVLHAPSVRWEE